MIQIVYKKHNVFNKVAVFEILSSNAINYLSLNRSIIIFKLMLYPLTVSAEKKIRRNKAEI